MSGYVRRTAAFKALWQAFASKGPSVAERMGALPRMVWATLRGRYDGGGRLFAVFAATLYVLSPIDFLPELVFLVFGLADDAIVVTWIAGTLLAETERFLQWERGMGVVPSEVIDGEMA